MYKMSVEGLQTLNSLPGSERVESVFVEVLTYNFGYFNKLVLQFPSDQSQIWLVLTCLPQD